MPSMRPHAMTAPLADAGATCEIYYVDEVRVRQVEQQMPAPELLQEVAQVFQVLSDPTRVRIVFALSSAELCVCDLSLLLGLSVSATSHQLRFLRSLGLVSFRKEGRLVYYTLSDAHVAQLLNDAVAHFEPAAAISQA